MVVVLLGGDGWGVGRDLKCRSHFSPNCIRHFLKYVQEKTLRPQYTLSHGIVAQTKPKSLNMFCSKEALTYLEKIESGANASSPLSASS